MAKSDESDLTHGCGQVFKYPGAYAKHGLKCDGTKPATSGRIVTTTKAPERTPPARKRPSVKRRKTKAGKTPANHSRTIPPPAPVRLPEILATLDVLAILRAERTKLDEAIRAVEALA